MDVSNSPCGGTRATIGIDGRKICIDSDKAFEGTPDDSRPPESGCSRGAEECENTLRVVVVAIIRNEVYVIGTAEQRAF